MTESEDIQQVFEELARLDVVEVRSNDYKTLLNNLSSKINALINHDFSALVQLLYQLDVSESKLKMYLTDTHNNSSELIAQLIIERQLEKIDSRRAFTKADHIPDDEKW